MTAEEAKRIVLLNYSTAKVIEVGDALRKGGGYGFYIVARRKALGRKGRTENEAWRNAALSLAKGKP